MRNKLTKYAPLVPHLVLYSRYTYLCAKIQVAVQIGINGYLEILGTNKCA